MRKQLPAHSHRFDTRHLSPLSALVANRVIGSLATMMVGVFFPIFLYEFFGGNLLHYFLLFALMYVIRIPLFILAAKTFSTIGLKVAMMIGTLGWATYYFLVRFLDMSIGSTVWVLAAAIAGLTLVHVFYWAPFHTDFATFSKKGKRGEEIGIISALKFILGVIAPIIGGWLIATYSYGTAFLAGVVLVLCSLIPLFYLPKVEVKYEYGFFESFKRLFSARERPMLISMVAYGMEGIVGYAAWPIFLFLVLDGKYLDIGIFAGVVVIVKVILQYLVSRMIDAKRATKKLLSVGVDVYALGWLAKAVVGSLGTVFAAATFHGLGSILMYTSFDVLMYEKAADAGHYIDEFTVLREVALTFGRVALLLVMAVITLWLPIQWAFVLAAAASVFISVFAKYQGERA